MSRDGLIPQPQSTFEGRHFDPTFIVGVPRSGTTLLVNLIGNHPSFAPIYETRFLRNLLLLCEHAVRLRRKTWLKGPLLNGYLKSRFPIELLRFKAKALSLHVPDSVPRHRQAYEDFPFGHSCVLYSREELESETDLFLKNMIPLPSCEREIYAACREFVDRLFSIHCSRMNRAFWVNKTPNLLQYSDLISKLCPSAKVIHIIRDGRDVTLSNLSLSWGPNSVRNAARRWKTLIQSWRRSKVTAGESCLELRYEDLINDPQGTLKFLFGFLGSNDNSLENSSRVKFYRERTGVWASSFSAQDRRIFAREAGDLLIELGYEKDYSWVSHRCRAD